MIILFDQHENVLEMINREHIREAYFTERINSPETINLTLSVESMPLSAVYLAHIDEHDRSHLHMYKITSTKIDGSTFEIEGIQSAYDDLIADGYVSDVRPNNQPLANVSDSILAGSRWQTRNVYTTETVTTHFYQLSRLEALQKVFDLGFEAKFHIEYKNGTFTRHVDWYKQFGQSRDVRYEYGDNLLEIIAEDQRRTIYTAIVGRGRGEEVFDEDGNITGYGRRINFRDVEWKKSSGDPVDKPASQEFVEIPELTAKYGYPDGKPRVLVSIFEDVDDPADLLQRSYNQLLSVSRPKVTFRTKVRDVGNTGIGDTVQVVRSDVDIRYETRIFERVVNLLDSSDVEITFGDKVFNWQTERIRELKQRLESVSENSISNLENVVNMIELATRDFWGEHGYNYDLEAGNEYNLPAGLYSFDRPIDQDPTKWVYLGAGKIVVSNRKNPDGTWILDTILDGDGLGTDVVGAKQVITGSLSTDIITLESGRTLTDGIDDLSESIRTNKTTITDQGIKVERHETRLNTTDGQLEDLWGELEAIELTPGEDGKSSFLHVAYADDSSGVGFSVNPSGKKYIGHAVTETSVVPPASSFTWSKYVGEDGKDGKDGAQGVRGEDGKDGQPTYTWIRYADTANGGNISNSPIGKTYIGLAHNKITATESDDPADYTWSLIKGDKGDQGDQGVRGEDGDDGQPTYTWIKYSPNSNGTGMTDIPNAQTKYIGIAVNKLTQNESDDHTDYTWSKFIGDKGDKGDQGDQGAQGVKGEKGDDGIQRYTWIRYADTATGVGINNSPVGKLYIGFAYNKLTATESNIPTDYKWSLIKGDKGDQGNQGVKGEDGADGQPTYTWIKYSANSDGTGLVDVPNANTKYIGIAVNKLTQAESGNKSDYTWSKFVGDKGDQGDQGAQGVKGDKGDDGIQRYTWIRYADTATGVGINNSPVGKLYIGFAYNKTTATESNIPTDYTWSLIKGEKGEQGNQGVKGEDGANGQPTYTWIKYSANADGTGLVDNPTANTKYIGIAVNKLTQSESNVKTDYTWSKFIGEDGAKGDKGDQGVPGIRGNDGEDGEPRYIWIRYADDENGTGMSDYPADKDFIGVAGNKTTSVESDNASDYTWSRINDHSRLDELGQLQEELQQAMQVGGRNLLQNSDRRDKEDGQNISLTVWGGHEQTATYSSDVPPGMTGMSVHRIATTSGSGGGYYDTADRITLVEGQEYTISYWLKFSEGSTFESQNFMGALNSGAGNIYITPPVVVPRDEHDVWHRLSGTFTATADHAPHGWRRRSIIYGQGEYWLSHFKLEKGPIATAYSRAPEDIEADIANAQNQADYAVTRTVEIVDGIIKITHVQELEDRADISEAEISNIAGSLQTVVKSDDYDIDKADILERIGELPTPDLVSEMIEGDRNLWVNQTFDNWTAIVQSVQEITGEQDVTLEEVRKFMNFGDDFLTIGATNSRTQIQITDKEINFIEGNRVIAYIEGNRLFIRTATILDSILIGNHIVERHQNSPDITVWRWVGN